MPALLWPGHWYARSGRKLAAQVGGDLGLAAVTLLSVALAWLVKASVDVVAVPAEQIARAAGQVSQASEAAASQVGRIPAVGEGVSDPIRSIASQVASMQGSALAQAASIHRLAWVLAVLTVVVPVGLGCWLWLPRRVRFARESAAAQVFIDSEADLDLFALRAMATVPLAELAAVSDDPVAAWRSGDRDVIGRLADLEFARSGLRGPGHAGHGAVQRLPVERQR